MNATRIVLTLAALGMAASAQSNSKPAAEQRYFNLVDAVQHSETLSDAELAALASDDLMRTKFSAAAGAKLTQEGLEAAAVHLCSADERDLIVIGNGGSFATTYAGPFWILRDLATGPVVALAETSLSLSTDPKRSNKCMNIETFAVTKTDGITTDYKFDGQKYVLSKQKSVKLP
jgi:hypothetical protein